MNILLEKFYKKLKEHFKNCYSNGGACHWKTSSLRCQCNCKFCENFKMKIEFIPCSIQNESYSELRYHSSNHIPFSQSKQYKNCDKKCWIYRFNSSEDISKFTKICNEMMVEIKWQKN